MDADESRADSTAGQRVDEEHIREGMNAQAMDSRPDLVQDHDESAEDNIILLNLDQETDSESSGGDDFVDAVEGLTEPEPEELQPVPVIDANATSQTGEVSKSAKPTDPKETRAIEERKIQDIFPPPPAELQKKPPIQQNGDVIFVMATRPQAAGKKPGKLMSKNPVRRELVGLIAQVAADDLATLFSTNDGSVKMVRYLIKYNSVAAANDAVAALERSRFVIGEEKVKLVAHKASPVDLKLNWSRRWAFHGEKAWYLSARLTLLGFKPDKWQRPKKVSERGGTFLRQSAADTDAGMNVNGPFESPNEKGMVIHGDYEAQTILSGLSRVPSQLTEMEVDNIPLVDLTQSDQLDPISIDIAPPLLSPSSEPRTTISQLTLVERQLQARYWGIVNEADTVRCNVCAESGHMAETCPARTCEHCKATDAHFSKSCPSIRKCAKCRERGHAAEQCPSKLARSAADGFHCDLCNKSGHVEEACTSLWRTFDPEKVPILMAVKTLVVSCYRCGSNRHWGDDCKIGPRSKSLDTNDTFSAKQADKYLIMPSGPSSRHGFSVKGRAVQANEGLLSEDDDPSRFYGTKVKKSGPRQGIQIKAAAASMAPSAGRTFPLPERQLRRYEESNRRHELNTARRSLSPQRRHPQNGDYRTREPQGFNYRYDRYSGWQPPLPNEPIPFQQRPSRGGRWNESFRPRR